jgi:hypothetical protein
MHPTVKPVALVADAIKMSRNALYRARSVLRLRYQLIAAEKTGRRARVIELDPAYCDVIVRRFQRFAGKKAVLAATGQTFEEVEEVRVPGAETANDEVPTSEKEIA